MWFACFMGIRINYMRNVICNVQRQHDVVYLDYSATLLVQASTCLRSMVYQGPAVTVCLEWRRQTRQAEWMKETRT